MSLALQADARRSTPRRSASGKAALTYDEPRRRTFLACDRLAFHPHTDSAPAAIGPPGSPAVIAAPTQSLWQTACIGMRTLIVCDWMLRRTSAVVVVTGTTW